jgi:hypothetical protein
MTDSLLCDDCGEHRALPAPDACNIPRTHFAAPPDLALGRCQALLQCHRETGHAGGHEARETAE